MLGLVAMMMMMGYDLELYGLSQYLVILNECERYTGIHHGSEYYYGMIFNWLTLSVGYLV